MPELQFKGKEFVHNHHLTVPFRPLEIDVAKGIGTPSLDGNLIIHGDNLHALKALLPTHAGKVDCIFIDPPYNTGNEGWAYNDNVNSPMIREWLKANPIGLEDGLRHDKWACMMWPRLKLLHELLADDGSFWMTLDDTEVASARSVLTEVFGENNFVTQIAWQKKYTISNDATWFSDTHDHIICFAKNAERWRPNRLGRTDEMNARYRNPDNHPKGPWKATPIHAKSGSINASIFEYEFSNGLKWSPPTGTFPRFSYETLKRLELSDEIWFGRDGSSQPAKKTFLSELNEGGTPPATVWLHGDVGNNHEAREEIKRFALEIDFSTPKPLRLLDRILSLGTDRDSLVLDSFAGSGTTAHAVLAANARDGGNRRFILVEGEHMLIR